MWSQNIVPLCKRGDQWQVICLIRLGSTKIKRIPTSQNGKNKKQLRKFALLFQYRDS